MGDNDRADAQPQVVQKCTHSSIQDRLIVVDTKKIGIPIQGSNFRLGITAKVETEAEGPITGWMKECSCNMENLTKGQLRTLNGLTKTYVSVVSQMFVNMCSEYADENTKQQIVDHVNKVLENDKYRKQVWDASPKPFRSTTATSSAGPSNFTGPFRIAKVDGVWTRSMVNSDPDLRTVGVQTHSQQSTSSAPASYKKQAPFPTPFQQAYTSEDISEEIGENIDIKKEELADLELEIPANSTGRNSYFAEVPLAVAMFPRINAYKRYEGKNNRLNTCDKNHRAFRANIFTASTVAMIPIPSTWKKYPDYNSAKFKLRETTLEPFQDGPFWSNDPGSFYLALTRYVRIGTVIYTPPGGGKTGFVYLMRNLGVRVIDSGELGVIKLPIKDDMLDATSYLIVTNSLQVTSNASKVLYVLPCESLYNKRLKEKARHNIGYNLLNERIQNTINGNPAHHFLLRTDRYLSDLPMSIDFVAPRYFNTAGLKDYLVQNSKWIASSSSPNE